MGDTEPLQYRMDSDDEIDKGHHRKRLPPSTECEPSGKQRRLNLDTPDGVKCQDHPLGLRPTDEGRRSHTTTDANGTTRRLKLLDNPPSNGWHKAVVQYRSQRARANQQADTG